jgi:hypothetical protein
MSRVARAFAAAALAACAAGAHAESLRCAGGISEVGDSRLAVLYRCGEPMLRDSYCAPLFYGGTAQVVPAPWASLVVPCLVIDEWVYDRGPGQLIATVRFRNGVVQAIHYGRDPH